MSKTFDQMKQAEHARAFAVASGDASTSEKAEAPRFVSEHAMREAADLRRERLKKRLRETRHQPS